MLQRIAMASQAEISRQTGIEKTSVHRIVCGERGVLLDEMQAFLGALNLAVIEADGGDTVTVPAAEYQALLTLARKALDGAT